MSLERLPGYSLSIPIQQYPSAPPPPVVPTAAIIANLVENVSESLRYNSPDAKLKRQAEAAQARNFLRRIPLQEKMEDQFFTDAANKQNFLSKRVYSPGSGVNTTLEAIDPAYSAAGGLAPVGSANEEAPLPEPDLPELTAEKPTLAPAPAPLKSIPLTADQANQEIPVKQPSAPLGYRVTGKIGPNEWLAVNAKGDEKTIKTEGSVKPVFHNDPSTGELYDVTDPKNPKKVKFKEDTEAGVVGEDVLTGMSEEDKSTIRKMANYEWPVPPGGIRNPKQLALLQKATLFDPSFSPSDYTIRQSTRKDYTSGGKTFQNIRSLNTLAGHLGNLDRSSDALNNGFNPTVNTFANWINTNMRGKSEVPTFRADVNAVTNELGQLLRGGAVTDQDVKRWNEVINSSQSPEQLKATIHEFADLAKSRLEALQQGYEGVMRKPADIQIVSPKAKDVFVKLGVLSPEDAAATPGGIAGYGKTAQPSVSTTPSAEVAKVASDPKHLYQLAVQRLQKPVNPSDPNDAVSRKKAQDVIDRLKQLGQVPSG